MSNVLRRDRGAVAGLLVVLIAAGLVSIAVDHRRDGGPVLRGAQAAARVLGGATAPEAGGAGLAQAVADLVTGGPTAAPSGPVLVAGPPSAGPDTPPQVPEDEPPEVPEPPPVELPGFDVPDEVRPLTNLTAPLGAEACQYLGLLPLAAALSGALGAPVSAADLLPYMQPLFDACLVIGVPVTETDCAIDQQIDDGADVPPIPAALGLTVGEVIEGVPVPTPLGVFIDEMEAVERLILGPPAEGEAPRFSDRLEAALACSQR